MCSLVLCQRLYAAKRRRSRNSCLDVKRNLRFVAEGNDYFPGLVYSLPMPWHLWRSFLALRCNGTFPRALLGAFFLPVAFAAASGPPCDNSEIFGAWEGEAKCTVPDSPCRDEHVIYEIAAKDASGGLKMDGYKVVNGERVFMGTLRCEYRAAKKVLGCTSRGKDSDDWEYKLSCDTLEGTLTINGRTLYRKITAKKVTVSSR
jgi:hypothetical protein